MNIRNCRLCGKIFTYVAGPAICQDCVKSQEAKFTEVNDYIRENPGVTIPQVSEHCDCDPNLIRKWLREDRIQLSEDSAITLSCESCGKSIRSGRFCDACKAKTASGINSMLDAARPKMEPVQQREKGRDAFHTRS